MRVAEPLLLYSTNTWLAWAISNRYYNGLHWIWCSPFFRPTGSTAASFPPSAIPGEIYDRLYLDVVRGDRHSPWVMKNRTGLMKGAQCKQDEGVISAEQKVEILSIVEIAQLSDFRPMLYVIPAGRVKKSLKSVPPEQRAHPMSLEYIIEALPSAAFDVVDVRNMVAHV